MAESIEDTIRRTAALARLALTADETRTLTPQFARILEAFRHLAGFQEAAPETAVAARTPAGRARPDEPQPFARPERLLEGAPRPIDGFYAVPRTVGDES